MMNSLCRRLHSNVDKFRSMSNLSYKHAVGRRPLIAKTVGDLLENAAEKFPEKVAVQSFQGESITFGNLLEKADKLGAGLMKLGLRRGDRLGIWAPSILEWEVTCMACSRIGVILVQLNPAYKANEIEYCVNKVEIKAIVCPEKVKKIEFFGILNELEDIGSFDNDRLNLKTMPSLKHIILISENKHKGVYNYGDLLEDSSAEDARKVLRGQENVNIDDGFNIQFTSGSTGQPKAALLSHFQVVNNSYLTSMMKHDPNVEQKICFQVPFFHTFGTTVGVVGSLHHGNTIVLPDSTYNPKAALKTIEQGCNVIFGTPTMYVDLINAQKELELDLNPFVAVTGGSPASPKLIEDMRNILNIKNIVSIYGLTETTCVVFHGSLETEEDKLYDFVGKISDHVEAKVVDAFNNLVPFGEAGELCVRGYSTMLGYWGDEKKTKETIDDKGWLRTGDKFVLHEDGYGQIVGRLKDMIIRGGENIYPKEIEGFLDEHPDIVESQVVGIPDERLGEIVCACLRTVDGKMVAQEDVQRFCDGKLAHYKIPSVVHVLESFPRTTSGKIQKFKLRDDILTKRNP